MQISRVLNTNAVLSKNSSGEEIILLGAGIGFKQKPGDMVDESKIEKKFTMKDPAQQSRLQELISSIPSDFIVVAENVIALAKDFYHMQLNESIHISLAAHIHSAIENAKIDVFIPNSMLLDVKQYYDREYVIGLEALKLIQKAFEISLPEDEAGFIAMHFVIAQSGSEQTNVKRLIEIVRDTNEMILKELNISPDEKSLHYYRYMTHLKFFAQRIHQNIHYAEDLSTPFQLLIGQYKREYACSKKVAKYIKKQYGYKVNNSEILYLTIHLAQLTQGQKS